jgi:CheY-like chemotaxis protein
MTRGIIRFVQRILVVDDDPDVRSTLLGALTGQGFIVEIAPDGREALERLACGSHPDLILLDLMMPVMNGWQFRARQLALPGFADIPIVVMTAFADLERAAITADYFLAKPIAISELSNVIRRCLAGESSPSMFVSTPANPGWHLVAPRRGESCRWEDGREGWVTVTMGDGEELGMAVVQSSRGGRESFDRYEDALNYCRSLRG